MHHAPHHSSRPQVAGSLFRPRAFDEPLYPVPLVDYTVKPAEVVKFAGQPFVRTADGEWLMVDHADVGVRETDD